RGGASNHESGGPCIHEPGGPSTYELGGPGTRGPGGLSSRDLQKSFTRSDTSRTQPIQKGQSYNWDDNQRFITKGGSVMRKFAKLDGTTWKNQHGLLKRDIITRSVASVIFKIGRSASTRNIFCNEKLRLDLESEKERSQALEENMKVMNKKQRRLQK
nr:myb domain protein 62 [Tanacetum cinerariifolium]